MKYCRKIRNNYYPPLCSRIEQKSKSFSSELQRLDSFYKNIHIVVIYSRLYDFKIEQFGIIHAQAFTDLMNV